jgi:hypothetical protein
MDLNKTKRYAVLGILFFLPVAFLLMLYPSTHNYDPLEVINENIKEVSIIKDNMLQDHITVLAFFGKKPMEKAIAASNLKELVYDKFKGFKKFQVIVIAPKGIEADYDQLKREVEQYEDLKFWHYIFCSEEDINAIYNSLKKDDALDGNLSTEEVFIIDKDRNQRGRIDDREDKEIENGLPVYGLNSYNCIKVNEIKNKMSDDMRILFTEYRQKRKGKFEDSNSRRAKDLKNE